MTTPNMWFLSQQLKLNPNLFFWFRSQRLSEAYKTTSMWQFMHLVGHESTPQQSAAQLRSPNTNQTTADQAHEGKTSQRTKLERFGCF